MKVLYAARLARFDLLRAVGQLASRFSTWDEGWDRQLSPLTCYINSSLSLRFIGWVGDPDGVPVAPFCRCGFWGLCSFTALNEWSAFGIVGTFDVFSAVWSEQRAEVRFLVYS